MSAVESFDPSFTIMISISSSISGQVKEESASSMNFSTLYAAMETVIVLFI